MSGHDFKIPGLIRAGFQYQDLVAIEVLIDFYRDPNLYAWVQLDAEDQAFRSVDDVVACRPDGLFELTQVKFAANPEAAHSRLTWSWLLEHRPKGRSLLQKWAATVCKHRADGSLARAMLKTDRIPDEEFAGCLQGSYVAWDLIPGERQALVATQLGSTEAAKAFFADFEFLHSQPRLDDLEEQLWSRIASDTDRGGWSLFRDQVERWATRTGQPHPDGRIRYIHLRQAFAAERPRPIPQDFLVPSGYRAPDATFDHAFRAKAFGADGLTVLWGPPGRGKSTYLSYCVAGANPETTVCIRHHYFLSLDDRSEGRFHFHAISQSLQQQLRDALPDIPRNFDVLGQRMAEAARMLAAEGRRLVVVVDGLDHVWREHRDREDMEELFAALLPLPANVSLVVGTQRIDPKNLPARLLRELPSDQWTELPLMSPDVVRNWVVEQDRAGRLNLDAVSPEHRRRVRRQVSNALHDISQGLPLHLIYSFESLTRTGEPVDADDVRQLPACPTGDIRDYYRAFWERCGPKARAILHVLAGLAFGPPPSSLHECFGRSDAALSAFAEISHLLEHRETGIQPFHGSLFAFTRELPDHDTIFRTHAPDVLTWLGGASAGYWRWAWLWITERQLGDSSALLHQTTRAWAIDGIAAGYPLSQVVTILDHAERAAFEVLDLERLLAIRSLRVRALNAPEFQMQEWHLIPEAAISLATEPAPHALVRGDLVNTPTSLIAFVVRSSDRSIRDRVAKAAIGELNRRIAQSRGDQVVHSDHQRNLARCIVEVVANLDPADAPRVVAFARRSDDQGLISAYARAARLSGRPENVQAMGRLFKSDGLVREVLTTLCLEGLRPSTIPELKNRGHPLLVCLDQVSGGAAHRVRTRRDVGRLFPQVVGEPGRFYEGTAGVLHEGFFAALAAGLAGRAARGWMQVPEGACGLWLVDAIRALEALADKVASAWRGGQKWLRLGDIYGNFDLKIPNTRSFEEQRRFTAVRLALRDIAFDLCTIGLSIDPQARISPSDLDTASSAPFWHDELWIEASLDRRAPIHTPEAVTALVEGNCRKLDGTVTEFMERADLLARLAVLAVDNGLRPAADTTLRRAIDCMLGYGWRKDLFAMEVLDSLSLLAKAGHSEAPSAILALADAFTQITEYTDGDETNHVRSQFYDELAAFFPDRVPACYAALIREADWRYAEGLAVAFARRADLETPVGQALLETYLPLAETAGLEEAAKDPARYGARAALNVVQRRTGRERPAAGRERYSNSQSTTDESDVSELPDPALYEPDRLQEFGRALSALRGYETKRGHVARWLDHWEAAGAGESALAALEAELSTRHPPFDLREALDAAFELALRIRGRTRALPLLIEAHVRSYAWQRWYTSAEEAESRLRTFAKHYPGQWRDFIRATARSPVGPRGADAEVVIGLSRLVFFLVEVGEIDEAWRCAREMARIFREEVSPQPLTTPAWAQ